MNGLLATGAALAVLVGLAHSVLGERLVLVPLFERGTLTPTLGHVGTTRRVLRFAWHLTSLAWWGFAAQLAIAAGLVGASGVTGLQAHLRVIAVTFLLSSLVTLLASKGRHFAWVVFLGIALCAWWGGGG